MPKHRIAAVLAGCLLVSSLANADVAARADNGTPTDRQIQQILIDIPTAQGALDDSKRLNEEAHYAGTVGDHDMAIWMRDELRSYGFTATIEPVRAPVPYLKRAALQLLVSPRVDFDLKDARIAQDPDGSRDDAGVPFNAWSGSGDVTAPLVYANLGLDADYATLTAAGVAVRGRIVLVRYGAEFRGALARRAMDRGAAGVILYSDPAARDGASNGTAYPDGPYRPLGSVQRGSVGTPVMKIPVLPVSAITARRLLQAVQGRPSPKDWHGGLDAEYALGTTVVPVHVRVEESYSPVTLWNTIGVLPGQDLSHSIILGGHRDAWVYGVTDNGSGISTLLEAARALGYVYRSGWRPHYSIAIAGWDGEEIGEAGSSSYVRTHLPSLTRGCIAYVNADETATGSFFYASGAAAIAGLVAQVARMVPDPRKPTQTVAEKWSAQAGGIRVRPPGGGSDHESFLYPLGIPTLEFGFGGPFGVYHSAYDDLRYAMTQADPGFANHRALAQMLALLAFRMTQGPLPYRLSPYVPVMRNALAQLAASSASGATVEPVAQAIDRFAARERLWERNNPGGDAWIETVHRLDLLLYGRNGYAAVAFPILSAAMQSGDASVAQRAAGSTAASLDAIASH